MSEDQHKEVKFGEKKVDENWKDNVSKNKEKTTTEKSKVDETDPISFSMFVTSLGMQVLMHLGEFPNPQTNEKSEDLVSAKGTIDLLAMMKEKTAGNLTDEEDKLMTNLLAELQVKYVEKVK